MLDNDRSSGLINGKRMRGRTKLLGSHIAYIHSSLFSGTENSQHQISSGVNLPFGGIDIYRVSSQRGAGHRLHKYLISGKIRVRPD